MWVGVCGWVGVGCLQKDSLRESLTLCGRYGCGWVIGSVCVCGWDCAGGYGCVWVNGRVGVLTHELFTTTSTVLTPAIMYGGVGVGCPQGAFTGTFLGRPHRLGHWPHSFLHGII